MPEIIYLKHFLTSLNLGFLPLEVIGLLTAITLAFFITREKTSYQIILAPIILLIGTLGLIPNPLVSAIAFTMGAFMIILKTG